MYLFRSLPDLIQLPNKTSYHGTYDTDMALTYTLDDLNDDHLLIIR